MKAEGLNDILQLELQSAETFVTLLKREQAALIAGNIEALALLSTEKISVVNQLLQLREQRSELLAARVLSVSAPGADTRLSSTQTAVANVVQQCQTLLQQARQLNHTNENILAQWLRQTRQSLQALRSAGGQVELYNPKGLTV
ncbi:MAG: flagellar protein FlgN [Nitrosomonas sp.]|nr:flagellar protein FlgN [Nitrosomonas sp.]